ncbi:UDP-N-acetylglucosamine 2-epimerase [Arcanobacterium haemolyticum]|uniref:UDP-N-acetylglucosamine 2-epimerase n=1 Tax=Arcanobacterium haemolyticum TaxID=28264 RepID=UPI000D9D60A5|nr:UDP-N-acetylglucosamine 2-epimerase [Arcanobacterium haemolyticum]SPT75495.1 UDP-N-acetylglucosamine 2-epimerase [Arcanobacterium haemolyticum]
MGIVFIAGTVAEFIKIAPVIHELERCGEKYQIWSTDQHVEGVAEVFSDLQIRNPDMHFISSKKRKTIASVGQVPGWFATILRFCFKNNARLKKELKGATVVVHGDTFTTVIGSFIARKYGAQLAHVEAGLRSGSLKSPFPEEMNRRIVGKIADIHFAPTETEVKNLNKSVKKDAKIVLTHANTVVDALKEVSSRSVDSLDLPDTFALVTLHRFELVQNKDQYVQIMNRIREFSQEIPVVMLVGKSEKVLMRNYGLEDFSDTDVMMIEKLPYAKFLAVLAKASLVVTDSGGLQEECAALGKPCAVHRAYTERHQGIGENIVLTKMDMKVLDQFLNNWESYHRNVDLDGMNPSQIIVQELR